MELLTDDICPSGSVKRAEILSTLDCMPSNSLGRPEVEARLRFSDDLLGSIPDNERAMVQSVGKRYQSCRWRSGLVGDGHCHIIALDLLPSDAPWGKERSKIGKPSPVTGINDALNEFKYLRAAFLGDSPKGDLDFVALGQHAMLEYVEFPSDVSDSDLVKMANLSQLKGMDFINGTNVTGSFATVLKSNSNLRFVGWPDRRMIPKYEELLDEICDRNSTKRYVSRKTLELGNPQIISVHAMITMLDSSKEGRLGPIWQGYRPDHNFGDATNTCIYYGEIVPDNSAWIYPGTTHDVTVNFLNTRDLKEQLRDGVCWRIQEGKKVVGRASMISYNETTQPTAGDCLPGNK